MRKCLRVFGLAALILGAGFASASNLLVTPAQATAFEGRAATVLVFLYTDCPIANTMAPELARINEWYSERGVRMFRVYADKDLSEQNLEQHGTDFGLEFPAVLDKDLALVKLTGATVTPEAVVYDKEGKRRYRGRINDLYVDLGKYRQAAKTHDLRNALEAVLAGRAVPNPETKAVGCFLPEVNADEAEQPAHSKKGESDEADNG